ncbi:MAG: MurR/RpiR family transcriptional regulator [Rhodospirillum sp.]|nr:MurR/RpiR family transcriptional regulator [Rhodospirillum sp.]MCF8490947.1 MurR/RpiR family transcriptional regulator [Rhodospirillum sp.]MCF8503012.1 MurR/RpiR family transcriptional regulator [Rhodospirillum sp.]
MDSNTESRIPGGSLVQRVQERYGSLRKSERIVADYLRENVGTRMDLSITELAKLLGLSEATISRVSRALGYSGFSDLKLSLAEGAVTQSTFANIPVEIDQTDTLIRTSGKLATLLAASIQGTQRMLDAERLEKCLDAMRKARKIAFIGVGGAAAMCDEAAHLFLKSGLDATAHADTYTQVVVAANLTPDCVMIGISHTGTTAGVAQALTLARKNGATTIAITSDAGSQVAKAADMALTTWNSGTPSIPLYGDFIEGRISQIFLIDLLYIGLLFEEGEERARHLKNTAAALETYYQRLGPDL